MLLALPLPSEVRLRVAEGYAYYGLYPETYLAAADAFASVHPAGEAVSIGLRSIGASLSAIVAAGLEAAGWPVSTLTLRPRGHPFDRRPRLSQWLSAWLADQRAAVFLIVDEGPGLSGSSFCGTAAALSALGIPDHRIVLFPSWPACGAGLRSEEARARWRRHRRHHVAFEDGWLARTRLGEDLRDVSAGAWRPLVYGHDAEWPAVQPQHERRKYLVRESGAPLLLKFAGLGRYGEAAAARARGLAEAGFAPPTRGLRAGFLAHDFVPARPLRRGEVDAGLLATVARYLGYRAGLLQLQPKFEPVSFEELCCMIRVNVGEGLGAGWEWHLDGLERLRPLIAAAPSVAIDGRMLPHEWLRTAHGYLKTDGVDHAAGHFFPGPTDIAWDVAGFAIEFGLPDATSRQLARHLSGRLADPSLVDRVPFHSLAYLAFRLGYCTLAAEALGGDADAGRFQALAAR